MGDQLKPDQDTTLAPLAPVPGCVVIDGKEIKIRPAGLTTLAHMAQALGPVMVQLQALEEGASPLAVLLPSIVDPLTAEGILHAAALGSKLEPDAVAALDGEQQLDLALAVLEVNMDFFGHRLPQLVARRLPTLAKGVAQLSGGPT